MDAQRRYQFGKYRGNANTFGLLIFILITSALARENRLSLVSDQGSILIYNCSVIGEGRTVWTGSAFNCPITNDSITLRHTNDYNTTAGTCNNGAITGEGVSVEGDCFTSQLNISVTPDLEGKYVICIYENGSSEQTIGIEFIRPFSTSTTGDMGAISVVIGGVIGGVLVVIAMILVVCGISITIVAVAYRMRQLYMSTSKIHSRSHQSLSEVATNTASSDHFTIESDLIQAGSAILTDTSEENLQGPNTLILDKEKKTLQIHFSFSQRFRCDCSNQKYTLDGHDTTIIIPEGVVDEEENIELDMSVAMHGPFIFPENIYPISPILWLYPHEAKITLKKPIQIIIPHCLDRLTKQSLHEGQVCFIRSDHKDSDTDGYYHFSRYSSNNDFSFDNYGVLETLHFGLFGVAKCGNVTQSSMSYCLAHVYLPPSPPTYSFYFYVLYNLSTHKRELEKQISKWSNPYYQYTDFTFQHKDGSFIKLLTLNSEIQVELEPLTGEIKECDINFWRTDYQEFQKQLESGQYPPRFKLIIRQCQSDFQVSYPIRFVGCTTKLELDLMLSTDAQLFEEAMQNGFVSMRAIVLLLIGVAGAGKTSFCHLILDEPPPVIRKSTPLAKSSIRAMSTSKAIIVTNTTGTIQEEREDIIWKRVLQQDFRSLIADAIKESKWSDHQLQAAIPEKDKPKVSFLTALQRLEPIDFYKWMQRKHREKEDTMPLPSEQNVDSQQTTSEDTTIQDMESNINFEVSSSDQILQAKSSCIKQLFESQSMQELFKLIANSKGSVELLRQEWLYIIDTGGQPQFHELLPTFVHHVSAAAFIVKLNETLLDHPMIEYYDEHGNQCGHPYESAHNHLQTIQNCLQAMQWRREIDGKPHCPELFFVGTHHDLESEQENIDFKNQCLNNELQQHDILRDHLAYHLVGEHDQLLYPVNAKNPEKSDMKIAANFRQDVDRRCKENAHNYKIPIRWFILEMLLQELSGESGVISYQECLDVAGHLKMNERRLRAAIEYLIKLNLFEYFPQILPEVVFTTSQVLLNKVTELVEYSHELRSSSFSNRDQIDIEFRDYGKITIKMLERERFSRHYVKGLFEPKHLLNLWMELLVVAKSPDGATMPAVLPSIPQEELLKYRLDIKSSNLEPIAVHYPGGLFPTGIFSCLVSYMQNKSKWEISMVHGKPACLTKNCIKFSVSGDVTANVTLIYSHNWIELHVTVSDKDKGKVCLFRDNLFEGLRHAETVQKYKNMQPKLAFFCDCQGEYYQHLAYISGACSRCSVDNEVFKDLTKKQEWWLKSLENKTSLPSLYIFEEHHTKLNQQNHSILYKLLRSYSAKWREIGTALGFLPHELEELEARPLLLTGAPRSFLSAMLADWLQRAPGDARKSSSFATLEGLKFALRSIPELRSIPGLETLAQNIGIPDY